MLLEVRGGGAVGRAVGWGMAREKRHVFKVDNGGPHEVLEKMR